MEIVKKNLLSIICGVIALGALVVGLVIIPGKKEELQKEVDARKARNDALASLLNADRKLPVVNPENPTEEKLPQFPSESVIKQGEAITKQVEAESKAMLEAAVAMNEHKLSPLLDPLTFPNPSPVQAFGFRTWYQQALPVQPNQGAVNPGFGINPAGVIAPVMRSKFAADLKAGMPPSPEDIRVKQEALTKDIRDHELFYVNGTPANQPLVDAKIKDRTMKLPEQLRDQVANTAKVYIAADTFETYQPIWAAQGAPNAVDMYFAQLGYWIQQDVVDAVAQINAKAANVKDATVKQLIKVRAKGMGGAPNFITNTDGTANADGDGALPKVPTISPTGRVSNGLYDVFHVQIEADVDANKLPEFLRGLGYRRFMTPLSMDVRARDNALALAEGHMYGPNPVLNVVVNCELLYLRKWNAPMMPAALKTKLGVVEQPAGGAAPATPATPAPAPDGAPAPPPV